MDAFLGELLGTATLILLGNGVVACVSLKGSYGENSGWIVIATGWGLAVISGVLVALAVGSNAHLNPAVTIGVSVYSGDWSLVSTYVPAQLLGALLGAVLVYLHYFQHWSGTADAAGKRACFCTSPAIRHIPSNLLSEIIGTFVLVFVAAAISSNNLSPTGLAPGFGPFLVGLLVWGIGLSLGGPTGYAINPARDLGPRIAHALLPIPGKGGSGWDYAPIPVLGPIIGAALAGIVVGVIDIQRGNTPISIVSAIAALAGLAIAYLTVALQSAKAARAHPVRALRYEQRNVFFGFRRSYPREYLFGSP